jgi:hypothetical protein
MINLEAAKNDGTFMGTILYDIPVISRTPKHGDIEDLAIRHLDSPVYQEYCILIIGE